MDMHRREEVLREPSAITLQLTDNPCVQTWVYQTSLSGLFEEAIGSRARPKHSEARREGCTPEKPGGVSEGHRTYLKEPAMPCAGTT